MHYSLPCLRELAKTKPVKIIYLDQNKWIELAQCWHGKRRDQELRDAVEYASEAAKRGAAVFPLSAIHYMETARISDGGRRQRLGKVMAHFSRGYTLASYRAIVTHELEVALANQLPGVTPRPFELLSRGVSHAFGMDRPPYRIPAKLRESIPDDVATAFEEKAQKLMEYAAITFTNPDGTVTPGIGYTEQNTRFKEHLEKLHARITSLPARQWEDVLHAMSMADILDPLNEVCEYHDINRERLEGLGKEGLTRLIDEMPSRMVDLQMHRQVLKNPTLRPRRTDLEDWAGLGPAAAYCDGLICEKHFADLLLRDGFVPKAKVLTDIRSVANIVG